MEEFEISVGINPINGGSVTGNGNYTEGDSVTLIATSNEKHIFSHWEYANDTILLDSIFSFIAARDSLLSAVFKPEYQITTIINPSNSGDISGEVVYTEGEIVTLTAIATENFIFKEWISENQVLSSSNVLEFTITQDSMITAHFQEQEVFYDIKTLSNPLIGGIITGAGTYKKGDSTSLVASSNYGYEFVDWNLNDSISTDSVLTVIAKSDSTFEARFIAKTYNISTTVNTEGSGTTTGSGTYSYNTTAQLIAIPSYGYDFKDWASGETVVSTDTLLDVTVKSDSTFEARFIAKTLECIHLTGQ